MDEKTTAFVTVPADLWNDILRVLESRQFISYGEDEDNDYDVQDVLERGRAI